MEAATAEFAAYGIAGARVDRIAQSAGCNKNLIYIYFENKETLFQTVLRKHLMKVYEASHFTPDDLPEYAAHIFDFAMEHPDLMRLMAWYALEQQAQGISERGASFRDKIAGLEKAQDAGEVGDTFPPNFLLTVTLTLATAWTAVNPFGSALDPNAVANPAALRQAIKSAVGLLCQARAGRPRGKR